ncbi:triple tyrosine motif-containing protein [Sphingobacterium sp. Mn56C]|uniref:triple tyrosine motif-containing protein n=1 Tax=Sphingobacterium sp. Mn56C TaxID=3395261 RepID=UPI003BE1EA66
MYNTKTVTLVLLYFLVSLSTWAQQITPIGTPHVQQYPKSLYAAGNQNWALSFSKNGLLYSANTEGLLSYDGSYWTLHKLPTKGILRSVLVADDDRIFTGGNEDFGYWERKPMGQLTYNSLKPLLDNPKTLDNDEIWKILAYDNAIYFHAFSKCYVYKAGKISILKANGEPFLFPHVSHNSLYFEQIPSGLHKLIRQQLLPIKSKHTLKNKNILAMLPYKDGQTIVATAQHGLYLMDAHGDVSVWDIPANALFRAYQINNGLALSGHQYAFGTIRNGLLIINDRGELIQHINKNNGLQNNTVLAIATDKQNNLWVGLDNGIDRIDLNTPLNYYTDFSGHIGSVYAAAIYGNSLYIGTNQGLFYSPFTPNGAFRPFQFKQVPGSSGQVWSLAVIDGKLYCGHNAGTFYVQDDLFEKIAAHTGGYFFYPVPTQNRVLQGNYTGLSSFLKGEKLMHSKQFEEIRKPISYLNQVGSNQFWLGNGSGYYLVELTPDFSALKVLMNTNTIPSLPKFSAVSTVEHSTVFSSEAGLYVFDPLLKKFTLPHDLNSQLQGFKYAHKILKLAEHKYIFASKAKWAAVNFLPNGKLSMDSSALLPLSHKTIHGYENSLSLGNGLYLIGLDNGFAIYNSQHEAKAVIPKPEISRVLNLSDFNATLTGDILQVPYKDNNVRIAFSLPYYADPQIQYQYKLVGYTQDWSVWSPETFKDYTNLPFGTYNFQVRARLSDGQVSQVSQLHIHIQTPWYAQPLMFVLYTIGLGLLLFGAYLWLRGWQAKKQFLLKRKLLQQQKIAITRETVENEQQLIRLKNQQLEKELDNKKRELANMATHMIYKNEMLNNLHNQLKELKDADGNRLSNEELHKIHNLIEKAHNDNRDWDIFEESFNESHESFFKKLKADYPDLVPNDLKLCAYLRLNMSSKEIASLLHITTRGVEIRRYRLRKKLGLSTEKNLTEFLMER